MSEELGAEMAAEPVAVVEAPVAEVAEAPQGNTSGDAIDRAFEKAGITERHPTHPERRPDGKFAPKEDAAAQETPAQAVETPPVVTPPSEHDTPPARFSADAKAAFKDAPLAVKAEIHRAFREMEGGIERYRSEFEPIRQYADMARQSGTTLDKALEQYTSIEAAIARNPVEGLDLICRNLGTDIRTVAAHIMGQPAPERDTVIEGLKAELAQVKQTVGGVTRTFEEQRTAQVTSQIQAFAEANPRFDELSGEIAQMLKTGYASDLQDAYDKAARLNPAPTMAPQPQTQAKPKVSHLSVQGAPAGSNPTRPHSKSSGEAIDRSFAALGIS
jgi:hypothetical protein